MMRFPELLVIILGYLLGSIPFAFILVKKKTGMDIRHQGSGNVGTTNASRILGKQWALVVLALDYAKGLFATLIGVSVGGPLGGGLVGFAAILGHMFPIWLGFKGGKGMATGFGMVCILSPLGTVYALLTWIVILFFSRYVSLASIGACLVFWGYTLVGDQVMGLKIILTLIVFAIIYLHRSNIKRLLAGTEPKFSGGSAK